MKRNILHKHNALGDFLLRGTNYDISIEGGMSMRKIFLLATVVLCLGGLPFSQAFAQALDFGDAPEGALAYPSLGVIGSFPTCNNVPIAGWIQHYLLYPVWFGPAREPEPEGNGGICPSFSPYNNDECFADGDAGLIIPPAYTIVGGVEVLCPNATAGALGNICQMAVWGSNVDIFVNNTSSYTGYVNVLMDWDQNGMWGGASTCPAGSAPEQVLTAFPVPSGFIGPLSALGPPPFLIGPNSGYVWTRFAIFQFPGGSGWTGEGSYGLGESEDYLLHIDPAQPTMLPVLTQCPVVETECPEDATRCPVVHTSCPVAQTHCPVETTLCPVVSTQCPAQPELTICPEVATQCPVVDTECPTLETKCPLVPTHCPVEQTLCPKDPPFCPPEEFTIWPAIPTQCPVVFTACPAGPTFCPAPPTACPMEPTWCPPVETQCPVEPVFTVCPLNPTQCPIEPTKCPLDYTNCPEIPTVCPVGSDLTTCPEIATQCPVVPTVCQTPAPTVCPVDPTYCPLSDTDGDGVLDCNDNCPKHFNPGQEDTYPPGGNGCGNACECEGNFDDNATVDGLDAATFKADYGRSSINKPCTNANPCNGDFSCNGNVDGLDAALFKSDFGRSGINNPCPSCPTDPWCVYP
jgi:hypothetical protein